MNSNQIKEAERLFQSTYGKTNEEAGFNAIDIYEKQSAYIYGQNQEVIHSYKISQNITRFFLRWYLWPVIVCIWWMVWLFAKNECHVTAFACSLLIFILGYLVFGFVLVGVGCYHFKKHKGKVTYLNY